MNISKRIQKEAQFLKNETQFSAVPDETNMMLWRATIKGPPDSPYEGGIFKLDIKLPEKYPFSPPIVKMKTQIFHPNIKEGEICVDILSNGWAAVLNIQKVLLSIVSLLNDPNPSSPLNSKAADLYEKDRDKYNETVKEWVEKYAREE